MDERRVLRGAYDRAAVAALSAARLAVAARAYPEADRCYVLALDLARWLTEPKRDVLAEAARAASWAGHPDRAASWIADALALSGGDQAGLLERLGRYYWEAGDIQAATQATARAVALLPDGSCRSLTGGGAVADQQECVSGAAGIDYAGMLSATATSSAAGRSCAETVSRWPCAFAGWLR